ncbi:hypothetical protein JCM10914A_17610 [Paenibacillus sp. JCM 10914]|uniref:hypothetical protein n=1 Tax=Paenibacillus sp. JCM 10914 TaxID=1236974 RepID=UPI0003CC2B6B|nr:hypothetical protein [Paenibacillus sp. JCM 10914]GAE06379.1 hypothetical protein JCM10914_2534 [Paenibacillus sp. JCM 10914]
MEQEKELQELKDRLERVERRLGMLPKSQRPVSSKKADITTLLFVLMLALLGVLQYIRMH